VGVPGGFSYGDYLRCGAIAAQSPIMRAVAAFAGKGGHVLGICNGFQVLCETRLLPGVLMRNAGLKFVCRTQGLTVATTDSPFTNGYKPGQGVAFPIAHHDGNYQIDADGLARLKGRIASPSPMRAIPTARPTTSPASCRTIAGFWASCPIPSVWWTQPMAAATGPRCLRRSALRWFPRDGPWQGLSSGGRGHSLLT
jgi:hypothetical protein